MAPLNSALLLLSLGVQLSEAVRVGEDDDSASRPSKSRSGSAPAPASTGAAPTADGPAPSADAANNTTDSTTGIPGKMEVPKVLTKCETNAACQDAAVKRVQTDGKWTTWSAYDLVINSVDVDGTGQSDCTKMALGPCSLVCEPEDTLRTMETDMWQKVQSHFDTGPIWQHAPYQDTQMEPTEQLIQERVNWNMEGYMPGWANCTKCIDNPNMNSCLDHQFSSRQFADPPDWQGIGEGKKWKTSKCSRQTFTKQTLAQRQNNSYCHNPVRGITIIAGEDGRLKNPQGRTGVQGRGQLPFWGPNKACDPVVVATGATLKKYKDEGQYENYQDWQDDAYYVRLVQKSDINVAALPGSMLRDNEPSKDACFRELYDMVPPPFPTKDVDPCDAKAKGGKLAATMKGLLKGCRWWENKELDPRDQVRNCIESWTGTPGYPVYRGMADDPRNTDDAWMETEGWLADLSNEGGPMCENLRKQMIMKTKTEKGPVVWAKLEDAAMGEVTAGKEKIACCYASQYAIVSLAWAKVKRL